MKRFITYLRGMDFPFAVFALYTCYLGSQAIYSTYLGLYLSGIGYTQSQIGLTVSVSTLFVLASQMSLGVITDKSKSKNRVLAVLFLLSSVCVLLFYLSQNYWYVLGVIALYAVLTNSIPPIIDSMALESAEGKRWNYGHVRTGGTIGYCLAVLLIGYVINERYERIFALAFPLLAVCLIMSLRMPRVAGMRNANNKTPFRVLLKNRPLLVVMGFYLSFSMGLSFFYNFYSIYFASIGGTSGQIGVMMFFCAVTEIPCLLIAGRMVKRFGIDKILILAGIVTCIRWILLFFLTSPTLIIAANLLHGLGYTSFSYCLVTYIASHVPPDLRTTSQTLNVMVGSIVSRFIFGYLGGLASERFGANNIMLIAAIIIGTVTVLFWFYSRKNKGAFA